MRVLRVARFAARFAHLGFEVADETLALMQQITDSGELSQLTPERVFKELEKVLVTEDPQVFFEVLRQCGALPVLFPEVDALFGVPAPAKWHPEIDTGVHLMMALKAAAIQDSDPIITFATLCHDFGKALTPEEVLPHHWDHEQGGVPLIRKFCQRLKIPKRFQQAAEITAANHTLVHTAFELKPSTIVKLFDRIDAWRKPDNLRILLLASQADLNGRLGFEDRPYPQRNYLQAMLDIANQADIKAITDKGYQGQAIREQLNAERIKLVCQGKQAWDGEND